MKDSSEVVVPLAGSDLLLSRVYTIGEVAKIVERRPDTIRKYERSGLIPKPVAVGEEYPSYKNWRFYSHPDVYEIVDFFLVCGCCLYCLRSRKRYSCVGAKGTNF